VDAVLETIKTSLGIPYDYGKYKGAATQLPDAFIVYTRIRSPAETWADGVIKTVQHRIQISYYTRTPSTLETVPDQIDAAMHAAYFTGGEWTDFPYFEETGHHGTHADFYYFERKG
jgi:hypothetical protein